ncbi:glycosyltransferase N-terminal domain-containing protein, partial [Streptococcus pneumoniae]|uniref:glycosyltransferase N-terminal domain-containing protein n=1 Tax=Streptococcus pneumoniae TaxID=1313 RepID=UPI001954E8FB
NMRLFYQLFIKLYPLIIRLISPFNKKAQKWVSGRKESFSLLTDFTTKNTKPITWMHSASLGEFEQGLPLLQQIKLSYPN